MVALYTYRCYGDKRIHYCEFGGVGVVNDWIEVFTITKGMD